MAPYKALIWFFVVLTGNCNGNLAYIGDGYCDDENNNLLCGYDGGDCCGANVNTLYCSECLCLDGSTPSSPLPTTSNTWPTYTGPTGSTTGTTTGQGPLFKL